MKRIRLNLASLEHHDWRTVYPMLAAAVLLVLGALFFNIHLYSRYQVEVHAYEQKISLLERPEPRQKPAVQEAPSKKDFESLRNQIGFVNRLIAMDTFPWDRLLDEMERCTPSDMVILRFSPTKENDKIRIEGKASSVREITDFLRALDQSSLYRNSVLLNVSTPKGSGDGGGYGAGLPIRFEIETVAAVEPNLFKKDSVK